MILYAMMQNRSTIIYYTEKAESDTQLLVNEI